jgi:hypothetical protein
VGKRQCAIAPIQIAFLQCLSFSRFEVAQRIKTACLFMVLFDEPDLIAAEEFRIENRGVMGRED